MKTNISPEKKIHLIKLFATIIIANFLVIFILISWQYQISKQLASAVREELLFLPETDGNRISSLEGHKVVRFLNKNLGHNFNQIFFTDMKDDIKFVSSNAYAVGFSNSYKFQKTFKDFYLKQTIYFDIEHKTSPYGILYFQIYIPTYALIIFLTTLIVLMTYIPVVRRLSKKEHEFLVATAIANTTYSVAHDLRSPYSMMKGMLNVIEKVDDLSKLKSILIAGTPEIHSAIQKANYIIDDLMQAGASEVNIICEKIDIIQIIRSSIIEIFKYSRKNKTSFVYDLQHTSLISGDTIQLGRVIGNILKNASEAMKGEGKIWFKSKNLKQGSQNMIELCIGNSGKRIDEKILPKLFNMFYTNDKRKGTGLGLAIAKKIIEAHQGKIFCRSSEDIGVEFVILLPALHESPLPNSLLYKADLPSSSSNIEN